MEFIIQQVYGAAGCEFGAHGRHISLMLIFLWSTQILTIANVGEVNNSLRMAIEPFRGDEREGGRSWEQDEGF